MNLPAFENRSCPCPENGEIVTRLKIAFVFILPILRQNSGEQFFGVVGSGD